MRLEWAYFESDRRSDGVASALISSPGLPNRLRHSFIHLILYWCCVVFCRLSPLRAINNSGPVEPFPPPGSSALCSNPMPINSSLFAFIPPPVWLSFFLVFALKSFLHRPMWPDIRTPHDTTNNLSVHWNVVMIINLTFSGVFVKHRSAHKKRNQSITLHMFFNI